jgi:hypothetical protein
LRFCFAFFHVDERYGDVTPSTVALRPVHCLFMKFFTKENWRTLQRVPPANDLLERIHQARAAYFEQLQTLRTRLSEDAFHFFMDADVHDGELLELVLEDGSRRVRLSVLDAPHKLVWTLSYNTVRRVMLDFPSEQPLFYQEGEGFGDWGYHELTDAGSGFLRHEILFASGAVLLFEFAGIAATSTPRTDWQR